VNLNEYHYPRKIGHLVNSTFRVQDENSVLLKLGESLATEDSWISERHSEKGHSPTAEGYFSNAVKKPFTQQTNLYVSVPYGP
jgi:hypothetical protein